MKTGITLRQYEIIEAAGKLLSFQGVSGLTIKKLAQEMGFSESALYRHFQSKEDIILTLLRYLYQNMQERFQELEDPSATPPQQLQQVFQSQFRFFKKHPYFVVAIFADGLLEESQKINQAIGRIMQLKKTVLEEILSRGQLIGEFTQEIPTSALAHIIMGSFRLLMYKWRMDNFGFDIEVNGENTIRSLLTLIQRKENTLPLTQ